MKLVHKFAFFHGMNFLILVGGLVYLSGLRAVVWAVFMGVLEFIQLWFLFIRPVDVLLSNSSFEFSKSLGLAEFDEVAKLLSSLSDDLDTQTEARKAATFLSEHDGLTGCYNRIRFNAQIDYYNSCSSLFVLMFDVNNLKRMNDEYGHKAGDALLRSAVEQLRYWVTYGDLYRIGGDEFLVVIVNYSEELCNGLLADWNGCNVILNRMDDGFRCLLAVGTAYGKDMNTLMKLADDRMYENKRRLKEEFGEGER